MVVDVGVLEWESETTRQTRNQHQNKKVFGDVQNFSLSSIRLPGGALFL